MIIALIKVSMSSYNTPYINLIIDLRAQINFLTLSLTQLICTMLLSFKSKITLKYLACGLGLITLLTPSFSLRSTTLFLSLILHLSPLQIKQISSYFARVKTDIYVQAYLSAFLYKTLSFQTVNSIVDPFIRKLVLLIQSITSLLSLAISRRLAL